MLEEILKKETLNEEDIKVISKNRHLLTQENLVRLGFAQPTEVEKTPEEVNVDRVPEKKVRVPRKKA